MASEKLPDYCTYELGMIEAGLEELQTAKACFVLRDKKTIENLGMLVLHVDDACFSGEREAWETTLNYIRSQFTLRKRLHCVYRFRSTTDSK